jgi:hypothetical protein
VSLSDRSALTTVFRGIEAVAAGVDSDGPGVGQHAVVTALHAPAGTSNVVDDQQVNKREQWRALPVWRYGCAGPARPLGIR